eukprot:5865994-Pleurochrysis_carterae.AAC.1
MYALPECAAAAVVARVCVCARRGERVKPRGCCPRRRRRARGARSQTSALPASLRAGTVPGYDEYY